MFAYEATLHAAWYFVVNETDIDCPVDDDDEVCGDDGRTYSSVYVLLLIWRFELLLTMVWNLNFKLTLILLPIYKKKNPNIHFFINRTFECLK